MMPLVVLEILSGLIFDSLKAKYHQQHLTWRGLSLRLQICIYTSLHVQDEKVIMKACKQVSHKRFYFLFF
jgi:hypothetical protein